MRAAWFLALPLAFGPTCVRADPGLPPVVDVAVPGGGGPIHLSIPEGYCGYPKEVRDRLENFLSDGGIRLLGAAGGCADIERLMRDGRSVVGFSLQLAMLGGDVAPSARTKPMAYRRQCFEQYPARQADFITDEIRRAAHDTGGGLSVGESSSLGRLDATRDAVFGGALVELSRAPDKILQVQVVVCFSPAGVPVLWTFQATMDRDTNPDAVTARLRSVLALAEAQVARTIELNRNGGGK